MQPTTLSGHAEHRLKPRGPVDTSADRAARPTRGEAEPFVINRAHVVASTSMTQTVGETESTTHATRPEDASDRAAYTVREVALLLGLSRGSTYALIREGRIPALRMSARWIVPKRRFHTWLDIEAWSEPAPPAAEAAP